MSNIAISSQQLSIKLAQRVLLQSMNVSIPQSRWTAVVGPNGAGKSTLLKAFAGLWPGQSAQRIHLLGREWSQWTSKDRARALAWLGQNEVASEELTSYDVVMLGRLPHQAWLASPTDQDHEVVEQSLRTTHAWDWRERALSQLSGGERQRVLLARALAVQAQVLLMDEPLANLDPPHQSDWLLNVRQLVQNGTTVVSVLHELVIALQADELLVMQQGQVVHQGPCSELATRQALEAVFEHRIQIKQVDGMWVALPKF